MRIAIPGAFGAAIFQLAEHMLTLFTRFHGRADAALKLAGGLKGFREGRFPLNNDSFQRTLLLLDALFLCLQLLQRLLKRFLCLKLALVSFLKGT